MREKIIAGNWKMNGTVSETESLIKDILAGNSKKDNVTVIVCPPYTSLYSANLLLKDSHIALGAQDVSVYQKGAYTAEVSVAMLLTVGVRFVILGHSERRQYHSETDRLVNAKAGFVIENGLIPIICVGETLQQRENGQTEQVVGEQIEGTLSGFTANLIDKLVVAYEPVWAIGTGKTATPEMAQEVHLYIRDKVAQIDKKAADSLPILYGGSVKPDNAESLLSQPDIDGALVGGASLKADDFIAIINAV
ncbi:MAG: triose-phosphate isomerase [Candidatus Zixiibacteriota bacterium]